MGRALVVDRSEGADKSLVPGAADSESAWELWACASLHVVGRGLLVSLAASRLTQVWRGISLRLIVRL